MRTILDSRDDPLMIMMCGLPGSGKTQRAQELAAQIRETKGACTVLSSDNIRKELFDDENYQEKNNKVFRVLHERARERLRDGESVIFDATNLSRKKRKAFLTSLKNITCYTCCYLMPTPYKKCLKNNKKRKRVVPVSVIERMYKSFNVPYYDEGFDYIHVDWSCLDKKRYKTSKLLRSLDKVKQENPHHTLSVGEHCWHAWDKVMTDILGLSPDKTSISCAALLHDIGKKFCKEKDENGIAHFYGHENVSAYMALPYLADSGNSLRQILETAYLINNHMKLINLNNIENQEQRTRALNRMRRKMGDDMMSKLEVLYAADIAAH